MLHLSRWQLALAAVALVALLLAVSGSVYHFVFLKAAREGWPVVAPLVRLIVRDEIAQRERFMRDNLDAIAQHRALLPANQRQAGNLADALTLDDRSGATGNLILEFNHGSGIVRWIRSVAPACEAAGSGQTCGRAA